MARALKFYATVSGRTLLLPDLSAFEGKRVEVIVVEDDETHMPAVEERASENKRRRFGTMAGQIVIAADFDAPLPDDIQAAFERTDDP